MFSNVKIPPSADETATTAASVLMSFAAAVAHSRLSLFVCFQLKRTPIGYSVLCTTKKCFGRELQCPDFRCEVSTVQQGYKISI